MALFVLLIFSANAVTQPPEWLEIKTITPIKTIKHIGDDPEYIPEDKAVIIRKVAPKFVNISITDKTDTAAIINYEVTEPVYTQIEYGTTTEYGTFGPKIENFDNTSFTQSIDNLLPNTTYHYRIKIVDQEAITVLSEDKVFVTNKSALHIKDSGIIATTETTVRIKVITNYKTTSEIQYKLQSDTDYSLSVKSTEMALAYNIEITNLTPDTTYDYHIIVTDEDGRFTK